jgi:hypothetical protein
MKREFVCSNCKNTWSQKADKDGFYDGYCSPPCSICGTHGSDPNDYGDFICPNCRYEWRKYGNGGLILGCWPNCPKCGTMADEA